jgi:hypothetical protein
MLDINPNNSQIQLKSVLSDQGFEVTLILFNPYSKIGAISKRVEVQNIQNFQDKKKTFFLR